MTLRWINADDPTPAGWYRIQIVGPVGNTRSDALSRDLRRLITTAWNMFGAGAAAAVAVNDHEGRCYCCLPVSYDDGERVLLVCGLVIYPAPDARANKRRE